MKALIMGGIHKDKKKLVNRRSKFLAEFHGVPAGHRIIDAVDKAKSIDEIVAIVPEDIDIETNKEITYYKQSNSFVNNLNIGLNHYALEEAILVILSDIPFLKSTTIDFLSEKSKEYPDAGFILPAVDQKTANKFSDIYYRPLHPMFEYNWKEGNAYIIRPNLISNFNEIFNDFFKYRDYTTQTRENLNLIKKYTSYKGLFFGAVWLVAYHLNRKTNTTLGLSYFLKQGTFENFASQIIDSQFKLIRTNRADLFLEFDIHEDYKTSEYEVLLNNFNEIEKRLNYM